MHDRSKILLMTFTEAFSTTLVGRGIFFYTVWALGFSGAANLWLALVYGTAYVIGAFVSHRLAKTLGEKTIMAVTALSQLALHLVLVWHFEPITLFAAYVVLGLMSGMRWPVVESYLSAGLTPKQTSKALGRFNLCWAVPLPLALALTGPIVKLLGTGLFLIPALVNLTSLLLTVRMKSRPTHLPADHPARPDSKELTKLSSLLWASRWLLMNSYASAWILASLLPIILLKIGMAEMAAPAFASILDFVRLLAFILMIYWPGWHGRPSVLLLTVVAMPVGFFMVLLAGNLALVLVGQIVFGMSCGLVYYAAIYYAMVVQNASVDAGGKHEAIIGLGFSMGPLAGLVGVGLAGVLANQTTGMLLGMSPLFLAATFGALAALKPLAQPRLHSKN